MHTRRNALALHRYIYSNMDQHVTCELSTDFGWLKASKQSYIYHDAHRIIATLYVIMVCSPIQVMLA